MSLITRVGGTHSIVPILYRSARCSLTTTAPTASASEQDNPKPASLAGEALKRWVSETGECHDALKVVSAVQGDWRLGQRGLTLASSEDINTGTVLVRLSRDQLLNSIFSNGPEFTALCQKIPKDMWPLSLGLVVLAERAKGARSSFEPYVKLLPTSYNGVPIFFGPNAIGALQYTPVITQITKRCKYFVDFANGPLAEVLFENQKVDLNAAGWGFASASSRAFTLDKTPSMLPLIDMANHSFSPNAKVRTEAEGGVSLVATEPIAAESEITISYGHVQNDELLLDYGFLVPENPFDSVSVPHDTQMMDFAKEIGGVDESVPLPTETSQAPWRTKVLEQIGIFGNGNNMEFKYAAVSDEFPLGVDPRLVALLRVYYIEDEQLLSGVSFEQLSGLKCDLTSPSIEEAVFRTSMGMCAILIASFKTKVEEDEYELEALDGQGKSKMDMALAIEFRLNKKRMLRDIINAHKRHLANIMSVV